MLEDEGADICMFLEYLQRYQFCKFPAETFPFSIVDNRERASNQLFTKKQEIIFINMALFGIYV